MIDLTLVPVDDELARIGRCWRCGRAFDEELYYCKADTWVTCLDCVCTMAVSENLPG